MNISKGIGTFFYGVAALVVGVLCILASTLWIESFQMPSLPIRTESEAMVEAAEPTDAVMLPPDTSSTETPVEILPTSTVILIKPSVDAMARMAQDPAVTSSLISVRVPVLMYHHIRPMWPNLNARERLFSVTPENFEAQMISLAKAGYHTITPDQLSQALASGPQVLPAKPVLLTFDDGLREDYTIIFPLLKRLHLQATFFVITQSGSLHGYLTNDMIKEMDQSGMATIASHTRRHAMLPRFGLATRESEIRGSKEDLEALLGHAVTAFAYPYGGWSNEIVKEVQDAGYTLGFWTRSGSLHTASSRYLLRRIQVVDREDIVSILDRFSQPLKR